MERCRLTAGRLAGPDQPIRDRFGFFPGGYRHYVGYLVADAADDSVIAYTDSLEDLLRIVRQSKKEQPDRELFFGRLDEHQGKFVSARSIVTARPLRVGEGFALYGR